MTREKINSLARECGYQHPDAVGTCEDFAYFDLCSFYKAAQAEAFEAVAKLCEYEYMPRLGERILEIG